MRTFSKSKSFLFQKSTDDVNPAGIKGLGELGNVGTAAAIASLTGRFPLSGETRTSSERRRVTEVADPSETWARPRSKAAAAATVPALRETRCSSKAKSAAVGHRLRLAPYSEL